MGCQTLDRVIEELKERGFIERFDVRGGQLRALGSGRLFNPEDLTIREDQRFEGILDPDGASIVYAIEACRGRRRDAAGGRTHLSSVPQRRRAKATANRWT
jgi:hypothetical protein